MRAPIYLDYNATTPVDPRVRERVLPFFESMYGNPSSRDHALGWNAAEAVEEARLHVAALIGARPAEIIFTSGATESINFALKGLAQVRRVTSDRIVTSTVEHAAVLEVCRQIEQLLSLSVRYMSVDRAGRARDDWAQDPERDRTCFVALTFADSETGTLQRLTSMSEVAHLAGAILFADITQGVGKLPIDIGSTGVDVAAFSAHKLYGPKGVGALYVRRADPPIEVEPLVVGGGQERGRRGGTLNVPGIVGFGEACRLASLEFEREGSRVSALRDRLEGTLIAELPDLWINGDRQARLPNTSNIGFAGVDARTLIRDMHDVAVSTQSACSSGSGRPSHVLKALGLSDDEALSSVRFSLGRFTTEDEVDRAVEKVVASVRRLRASAGLTSHRPTGLAGGEGA